MYQDLGYPGHTELHSCNERISLSWNLQIFIFLSTSEAFFSSYVEPEARRDSMHFGFYETEQSVVPLAVSGHIFFFQVVVIVLLL